MLFIICLNFFEKVPSKGSLLLPCPKMPIGIFLFANKFEFQKSEENGEKRRKPEKISGFSVGIFFCQDALRHVDKKDATVFIRYITQIFEKIALFF